MSTMYLHKNPSRPRNDLSSVVSSGSGHPKMARALSAVGRMPCHLTLLSLEICDFRLANFDFEIQVEMMLVL